ncbi:MAG: hypothetical protein QF412_07860 [Planctomycetota bacterium]|nr:hypothetical protein [Planctomycetota bacterium]
MTGRKKGNWSSHELGRLRVLYPGHREEEVARLLHRSVESVRTRAKILFEASHRSGDWESHEDRQLRISHGVLDFAGLCLVLARSREDVGRRIEEIRLERREGLWSAEEDRLLRRLHGSRSDADLEFCLSRSAREIGERAALLCLSKDKRMSARLGVIPQSPVRMPRWTESEVELLRQIYPDRDNLEVARCLGRSVVSVANKASQLGLKKSESMLRRMGQKNVSSRYASQSYDEG